MPSWGRGWGQFDELPSSQICFSWRNEPVIFLHKYWKNKQREDLKLGTVRAGTQAELSSCCVLSSGNAGAVGEQASVRKSGVCIPSRKAQGICRGRVGGWEI